MNYLKIETCQLLEKLGCTTSSGASWDTQDVVRVVLDRNSEVCELRDLPGMQGKYSPAFTWDDICTKENAIKIWGDGRDLNEVMAQPNYLEELRKLLDKKLKGGDWEAELLKHLKALPRE